MTRIPVELRDAYRRTSYWVETPACVYRLRIDARHSAFDVWLQGHGVANWAFITAVNPQSRRLPEAENVRRQSQLAARLAAEGWRFSPGRGQGDDRAWPAESSWLIFGIESDAALRLAREFDQAAFVTGRIGDQARLVWCDPCDDADGGRAGSP